MTTLESGSTPSGAEQRSVDPAEPMDLDRLAAGDSSEWKRFLTFSHGIIQAAAYKVGLQADERDELGQVTCVICFQAISKLRDPASLSSWVYRIAYRQGLKIIRGRISSPATSDEDSDWLLERFACDAPTEIEVLERNETSLQLRWAIAELGDPCTRLLTVLYLEDELPSYDDVSQRTGMPIGSIGPTRARCLERARHTLKYVSEQGQFATKRKKSEE